MNSSLLKAALKKAEGERLKPYQDTLGVLTIGVGRNLQSNGIRKSEMEFMLDNDVTDVAVECGHLPCWLTLSDVRQRVIAEMCFQMGFAGLLAFKKMFAAIDAGDFVKASDEMLNSKWATQTAGRAHRLSQMLRTDKDVE